MEIARECPLSVELKFTKDASPATALRECKLGGTCNEAGWRVHWRDCPDFKKQQKEVKQ